MVVIKQYISIMYIVFILERNFFLTIILALSMIRREDYGKLSKTEITPELGTKSTSFNKDTTWITELKALVKIGIVNSNLITTFVGFWLALHVTGSSFINNIEAFILTIVGSALVIAGGAVLNNWYDVDIDPVMKRTKLRPTVTGRISLKVAFRIGFFYYLL